MVVANGKGGEVLVSQAQFTAMLFLDGAAPVVRVCVEPEGEQSSGVRIESSVAAGGWVQHAMVVATVEAEVVGEVAVGSISDGSAGCVSGASLYGSSTGNEYLGGFWSVDAVVWVLSRDDGQLVVSSKVGGGALREQAVHGVSQAEQQRLQLVSWMDGSSQLDVLSEPEHGGRPRVFAGVEAQGEGDQHGMSNRMSEWVAQVAGSGGRSTYLRSGQLEVVRTGQHLYDTAWEAVPAADQSSKFRDDSTTAMLVIGDARSSLALISVALSQSSAGFSCAVCSAAVPLVGLIQVAQSIPVQTKLWLCSGSLESGVLSFARSLRLERRALSCAHITTTDGCWSSVVLWANGQTEDELVVRNGCYAAPRLKLLLLPALQITNTVQHDQAACYSLTGGTGALGLVVAVFMATRGAGQLVLLSRSGRGSKGKHWQQLQEAYAEVAVCCSDVSVELSGTGQVSAGIGACSWSGNVCRAV